MPARDERRLTRRQLTVLERVRLARDTALVDGGVDKTVAAAPMHGEGGASSRSWRLLASRAGDGSCQRQQRYFLN